MFSWLFPATCPVQPDRKLFLERGLNWLYDQFGEERMLQRPMIEPTPEYFPDAYDPEDRESLKTLFARVCQYMEIDRKRVNLRLFDDRADDRPREGTFEGAAGTYHRTGSGRETIRIAKSKLNDPTALIGTMAHELGHVHLLGDGRLTDDNPDHEHLTDLLTVVYGMGIFTANSVIRDTNWRVGNTEGWSVGRQGYLFGNEYGYAFALVAWAREEDSPQWLGHLRLDVRSACKQGIRFLRKTQDTVFRKKEELPDRTAFERHSKSDHAVDSTNDDLPWERRGTRNRESDEDDRLDRLPWEK